MSARMGQAGGGRSGSLRTGSLRSGSLRSGASLVAVSVVTLVAVMLVTAQLGHRMRIGEVAAWAQADAGTADTIGQPDRSLDDGILDPVWSEPLDGLEVRLRTERTTWQSWQQPVVVLDVRNAGEKTIPAADLRRRVPVDRRNGLMLMRKPTAVPPESTYLRLEIQVRFDVDSIPDLQPGETFSLPIALASTFLSYDSGLQADDVSIGVGRVLPRFEPQFVSNLVAVQILPPGVRSMPELAALLKQYDADGRAIEAGFVPAATTLVDGERLRMTFLVRNSGQEMFAYSFGGDYRGANRHNRFKVEIRDARGELLPDPAGQFGDFGGLLSRPIVEPGRIMPTTIDLTCISHH
ncbi:MAG: hypothetical protein O3C40_25255, partial [Planctomycetota bacterium]|nr:hypothetical protein [Planctomycetota bacterium]